MAAGVPGTVLKRERARDAVLEPIESRSPGDAIPSERALCALLGVSGPTVRAVAYGGIRPGAPPGHSGSLVSGTRQGQADQCIRCS